MKILQVVKTNRGATWAFNQAKALKDNGVEIVTVLPDIESGYALKYKENGLKVIKGDWQLPVTKPWKIFKKKIEINNVIEKEKPDLIHLHFVTNVYMIRIALHKNSTPRLFQVPGPLHLENKLFRYIDKLLSTHVDYWAGACKKTCEIYKSMGIDQNRVFLGYYGTYQGKQDEKNMSLNILHQQYGIDEKSPIIAMVSYFYKPKKYLGQKRGLKGHEDFIDALDIVIKKHPEITPMIIGNAWDGAEKYEVEVQNYAKMKMGNKIIFTGYRSDISKIYPEISIAVHPSHSENLGGAAESLAYGVPTIASSVGGFPDIVIEGKTGLLTEAKNPEMLADKIMWMIEHYEAACNMASKGEKYVRNLLDIQNTSNIIENIYNKILDKK